MDAKLKDSDWYIVEDTLHNGTRRWGICAGIGGGSIRLEVESAERAQSILALMRREITGVGLTVSASRRKDPYEPTVSSRILHDGELVGTAAAATEPRVQLKCDDCGAEWIGPESDPCPLCDSGA